MKQSLLSVNHEQFPMQMKHKHSRCKTSPRKIFHRNSSGTRTPTSNLARTTRTRRQQETAEQREHRPAQRRQRHQQETEEQDIGIRGIMIVLQCAKPRLLSLPVSPPIYRSTSAKLQFSITARSIIIFRRTALPYFFLFFAFF